MKQIIINYDDTLNLFEVLRKVGKVVDQGLISESSGIPHYCWMTTFNRGGSVSVTRKRSKNSADSFTVLP